MPTRVHIFLFCSNFVSYLLQCFSRAPVEGEEPVEVGPIEIQTLIIYVYIISVVLLVLLLFFFFKKTFPWFCFILYPRSMQHQVRVKFPLVWSMTTYRNARKVASLYKVFDQALMKAK